MCRKQRLEPGHVGKGIIYDDRSCRRTKRICDGLTVEELIEAEKVETPQYVTVTVNDTFLSNAEGRPKPTGRDVVEFLYFMGAARSRLCAQPRLMRVPILKASFERNSMKKRMNS